MAATSIRPTSVRFDEETNALLELLVQRLGVAQSDVLRMAIRLLARREGVKAPKEMTK
jgi:Arc/MetJ-type ribon-helix-helix transcriptional regulator